MTNLYNLFTGFNDLTKNKLEEDTHFNKNNSIALNQGEKFKNYQQKIKKNLEVNSKEGFQGFNQIQDNINKNPHGLAAQTNKIIKNNDFSSQKQTIHNLKKEYKNTLNEYENLTAKINGIATGYLNRVNPNNPYLNKTVKFSSGQIAYVTNQGVVKYIPSKEIWDSVSAPKQYTQIDMPWDKLWNTPGRHIPTTPPLVSGTFVVQGQSLGNEGSNVFVNELINNPSSKYMGCYADDITTPLMTFIGGAPVIPSPEINLQNGNFDQPQIANNSYKIFNSNSTEVPGWWFNCYLANNSTAWKFPLPYPSGNQCAVIQQLQQLRTEFINLTAGVTYTLSFSACNRPNYQPNPINIGIVGKSAFYTLNPSIIWDNYTTDFTVENSGNCILFFLGTIRSTSCATAIQNIKLSSSGSDNLPSGSYTIDQCQEAAVDEGYQYFALQSVNNETSKGYCAVSNDQPTITSLGESTVPNQSVLLWASNTTGDKQGSVAILNGIGTLAVNNTSGSSVYLTPLPQDVVSSPNPFIGCYNYSKNASKYEIPGAKYYSMTFDECKDLATDKGYQYFGIGGGIKGDKIKRCMGVDDPKLDGPANNCANPNGGFWSASVYATDNAKGLCFLILQDDGNMCIYKGTGPNDNQGLIWSAETTGKQQSGNPKYVAINGKYGKNYIISESTLAPGDFVGSTNGNLVLIMQSDGNLVLNTYTEVSNCQKMSDGNIGAGQGGNAIYDIGKISIPANMSKLAYIDQNSKLYLYPETKTKYSNIYSKMTGNNSPDYDIPDAMYGNATVESCQTTCNNNAECGGFTFSNTNVCYPKTSSMYPNGERQLNAEYDLYMRGKLPKERPIGVPSTVNNIDTVSYQNYIDGGKLKKKYGLTTANSVQKQQLNQLQTKMNLLSSQLATLTGKFNSGTNQVHSQSESNVTGIQEYLKGINTSNHKISNLKNNNIENILSDSDIVVLQKNYNYLFWSILAAGTVLVTMNIVKK